LQFKIDCFQLSAVEEREMGKWQNENLMKINSTTAKRDDQIFTENQLLKALL
jgi:hypothetical protein